MSAEAAIELPRYLPVSRDRQGAQPVDMPLVGSWYWVTMVSIDRQSHQWWGASWLPVLGDRHEDVEIIKFPHCHWHIDWRFVGREIFDSSIAGFGSGSGFRLVLTHRQAMDQISTRRARVRCKRPFPPYVEPSVVKWLPELEAKYKDHQMKCLRCPHHGLPLDPAGQGEVGNTVTCRGHGLRWHLETGKLVRQTAES